MVVPRSPRDIHMKYISRSCIKNGKDPWIILICIDYRTWRHTCIQKVFLFLQTKNSALVHALRIQEQNLDPPAACRKFLMLDTNIENLGPLRHFL